MVFTQQIQLIANTGGSVSIPVTSIPDYILLYPTTGTTTTLTNNYTIGFSALPLNGQRIEFEVNPGLFLLGGHTFTIATNTVSQYMLTTGGRFVVTVANGVIEFDFVPNLVNTISGSILTNNTVALAALTGLNNGQVIIGNVSNVPVAVTPTGDITITNAGVTNITTAAVTNIKINPGSNNSAKVTDNSGNITDIVLNAGQYLGNLGGGIQAVSLNPSGLNTSAWTLTGNSGTTPGTNFIGTVDNNALYFKVNNIQAGLITVGLSGPTAFGYQAMLSNSGLQNVAFGNSALQGTTSGSYNTAIGCSAIGSGTIGSNNTAIGVNSLTTASSGSDNTAVGYTSLQSNTTGGLNVAIGSQALLSNSTGNNNTALGYQALNANSSGGVNVGIGTAALQSLSTGSNNVGIGGLANVSTGATTNAIALGYNSVADSNQFAIPSTITSLSFTGIITAILGQLPRYDTNAVAIANGLVTNQLFVSTGVSGLTKGVVCQVY